MNILGLLEKFLNRNDDINGGIAISEDFCVRLKSPMASCYECINKCPDQAVKISDSRIEILNTCTICGACVYICPNSVFDFKNRKNMEPKKDFAQANLIDNENQKSNNIYYFCSKIKEITGITENDINESSVSRVSAANLINDGMKISCVSEIDDLELVKLFSAGKKILIVKEDCKLCKLNYFHKKKSKRIIEIEKFFNSGDFHSDAVIKEILWVDFDIKDFEREQKGLSESSMNETLNDKNANGVQLDQSNRFHKKNKEIARREFFKNSFNGIKNKAKEFAGELSIEDLPFSELYSQYLDYGDKQGKKMNGRLIKRQRDTYKFLKENPKLLPLFNIRLPKINKNCVFCGNCWELCPTGALKFEGKAIFLEPFLCTGCNLCKDLCSFGAVRMYKATRLSDIAKEIELLCQTEFE